MIDVIVGTSEAKEPVAARTVRFHGIDGALQVDIPTFVPLLDPQDHAVQIICAPTAAGGEYLAESLFIFVQLEIAVSVLIPVAHESPACLGLDIRNGRGKPGQ